MSFWKPGIEPRSVAKLVDGARVILLLRVGLAKQKVDRGVVSILLQQPAKNTSSSSRLAGADQSGAPRQQQTSIVGWMFEKGVENFNDFLIFLQHGIAEAQKLADERVVRMGFELALEGWNSFQVELGAETGESPVEIQPGEIGLPCGSLPEKLGSFWKFRVFGPHHAQVIIGTAQDFSDK